MVLLTSAHINIPAVRDALITTMNRGHRLFNESDSTESSMMATFRNTEPEIRNRMKDLVIFMKASKG